MGLSPAPVLHYFLINQYLCSPQICILTEFWGIVNIFNNQSKKLFFSFK